MNTAETYTEWLKDFDLETLHTRHSQLSFWINTYNMLTLYTVEKNLQRDSSFSRKGNKDLLQRIRFFWYTKHHIGDRQYSLYQIENRILRKMNEPRIHFALNCASASCPLLKNGLYSEESLELELENAAHTFIQSPRGVTIDRSSNTVRLSRIFKWYRKDFKTVAGGVLQYIQIYLPEDDRSYLENHISRISIQYMKYDWKLHTDTATQAHR